LLDGFDFGAGAIQMLVARTPEERRQAIASIGPLWDGNEVWLLAAGGTLYFAFPALYASEFSGFYLPLMIVLWLLILPRHIRGIPPTTSRARCGFRCGILCFAFPACCCAYFLARRSATSFAACLWMPPPGRADWNPRLIHHPRWRHRATRSRDAWWSVGAIQNHATPTLFIYSNVADSLNLTESLVFRGLM
jgi:Cytochrome bd terminal oxidase subunit II